MKHFTNSIRNSTEVGKSYHFGKTLTPQPEHLEQLMDISFHFDISKEQEDVFNQKLESGEILTLDFIQQNFSPEQGNVDRLIHWLQENHYTNIKQSADKRNVYGTTNS
jgi:hypothetical protein